jgi:hypothetical protein
MPDRNFSTEVLTNEVVVGHRGDGHIFRFSILANGTITIQRQSVARRYLTEAYIAAQEALRGDEHGSKEG